VTKKAGRARKKGAEAPFFMQQQAAYFLLSAVHFFM
jgi:hypothetical protein